MHTDNGGTAPILVSSALSFAEEKSQKTQDADFRCFASHVKDSTFPRSPGVMSAVPFSTRSASTSTKKNKTQAHTHTHTPLACWHNKRCR